MNRRQRLLILAAVFVLLVLWTITPIAQAVVVQLERWGVGPQHGRCYEGQPGCQ